VPATTAVSAEIGRGHPGYLDSVLAELRTAGVAVSLVRAGGPGWALARNAYRLGAQGGVPSTLYRRLRSGKRPSRLQLQLLDSGLRRRFAGCEDAVLVDHPLLAHLLAPVCRVAYLHAEIAAPAFCAVPEARHTFVPLDSTAARLEALGARREALCVTGLVVEPALVAAAETAFRARLARIGARRAQREALCPTSLTVAFFTSGAYPRPHLEALQAAVGSVLAAGHQAVVFPGCDRKRFEQLCLRLAEFGFVHLCSASRTIRQDAGECHLVVPRTRPAETACTALNFDRLDVMVAAAHERTNWAVGLGLPMFALLPHIGPFAPENFAFAREQGVCLPLDDPAGLGPQLTDLLCSGRLLEMSRAGWGRHSIAGADAVARFLAGHRD